MSTSCIAAWAAVLLTLPVIVLLWATEAPAVRRRRRIGRLRAQGCTWATIAADLGVSPSTARRWAV